MVRAEQGDRIVVTLFFAQIVGVADHVDVLHGEAHYADEAAPTIVVKQILQSLGECLGKAAIDLKIEVMVGVGLHEPLVVHRTLKWVIVDTHHAGQANRDDCANPQGGFEFLDLDDFTETVPGPWPKAGIVFAFADVVETFLEPLAVNAFVHQDRLQALAVTKKIHKPHVG